MLSTMCRDSHIYTDSFTLSLPSTRAHSARASPTSSQSTGRPGEDLTAESNAGECCCFYYTKSLNIYLERNTNLAYWHAFSTAWLQRSSRPPRSAQDDRAQRGGEIHRSLITGVSRHRHFATTEALETTCVGKGCFQQLNRCDKGSGCG